MSLTGGDSKKKVRLDGKELVIVEKVKLQKK